MLMHLSAGEGTALSVVRLVRILRIIRVISFLEKVTGVHHEAEVSMICLDTHIHCRWFTWCQPFSKGWRASCGCWCYGWVRVHTCIHLAPVVVSSIPHHHMYSGYLTLHLCGSWQRLLWGLGVALALMITLTWSISTPGVPQEGAGRYRRHWPTFWNGDPACVDLTCRTCLNSDTLVCFRFLGPWWHWSRSTRTTVLWWCKGK